jgi:secreted trypsin-like serine protease
MGTLRSTAGGVRLHRYERAALRTGSAPRRARGTARAVVAALILAWPCSGAAVMAGAAPDTPEARVDPNVAASPWAGVGSVVVNGRPFSGVVIGPRHVLTAAHVAGDPAHTRFRLNLGGEAADLIAVAKVHRHPSFKNFDPQHPRDDLAILVLAEDLPANVPRYALHRGDIEAGAVLTFVGYGASGHGDAGVSVGAKADVKRKGRSTTDAFVQDAFGIKRVFAFDFDGPGADNPMGGEGLGNGVESSFAGGDSGGPSFLCEGGIGDRCVGGRWLLAGINTFVSVPAGRTAKVSTFGTLGGGMVVSAYVDWIESVLKAGGEE